MSLRIRFAIGIAAMLLPLVMSVAVAHLYLLPRLRQSLEEVIEETVEEMTPILHLQNAVLKGAMPANDYLIHGDPAERERFATLSQAVDRAFEEALAAPYALEEERALVQAAWEEWQQARPLSEAILALPHPVGDAAAAQAMERLNAHVDRAVGLLDQAHGLAHQEMHEEQAAAQADRRRGVFLTVGIFGVALGIAVAASLVLAHSVLAPVRALRKATIRFGEGDLAYRVALDRRDELGELAWAFNAMADKIAESQAALEALATHDSLTGLYNRREFHRRLTEEVTRSRRYNHPFSLLMLDMDHLKSINDTYGHQAGDEALRTVAAVCRCELRSTDQPARYGGDEFAILLTETPGPVALTLAERLCSATADAIVAVAAGQDIKLTASIGVAVFPDHTDSEESLIAAADQALYAAKQAGRNRVCHVGQPALDD